MAEEAAEHRILDHTISSVTGEVQEFLRETRSFVAGHSPEDATSLIIVLRELLDNAVVHGNARSADRKIRCRVVCQGSGRFEATVEDQGKGFDHSLVEKAAPADPRQAERRGFILIYSLSMEVRFNETGNRVTAVVDLNDRAKMGKATGGCVSSGDHIQEGKKGERA